MPLYHFLKKNTCVTLTNPIGKVLWIERVTKPSYLEDNIGGSRVGVGVTFTGVSFPVAIFINNSSLTLLVSNRLGDQPTQPTHPTQLTSWG